MSTPVLANSLHDAIRAGEFSTVKRLVTSGADLEGKDDAALTPLIVAVLGGDNNVVSLLLANGAVPGGRDGKGFTALHAAAHKGHADLLKRFVTLGLNVDDRRNEQKLAPLHLAAERGHYRAAENLLASGADVNVKTGHGRPPIWLAVLNTHPRMVKLLRDNGGKCPKSKLKKYNDYCKFAGN
jgi:ankyrin repeat protein